MMQQENFLTAKDLIEVLKDYPDAPIILAKEFGEYAYLKPEGVFFEDNIDDTPAIYLHYIKDEVNNG